MPPGQYLLAFFILQRTARCQRMNILRHSLFLCLNAGKGGLRKQMIPELARHKRKETLCQSKELRIL